MSQTSNPFNNRGMITNLDDFFGRKEQIREITTRLRAMQSSSVVGERRIGKSSLLYHLCQTGALRMNESSYQFCYVDLQDAHFHTSLRFFQTVLNKLGVSSDGVKQENSLNGNLIAFTDRIEMLERAGQRVVLCLDEFENTFKHREQFTEDFPDHMRAQINARKMALITSTARGLQRLSLEGKLTSPFYNVFTLVELKDFPEGEAHDFLAAQDLRVRFSDSELMFIFSQRETHPLKLQILCDWVMKNRQRGLAEDEVAKAITTEYGNFFVGKFDPKRLLKAKRSVSLDNIRKLLETIKTARSIVSGSGKE